MAESTFRTVRGIYRLVEAAPAQQSSNGLTLTLALEHAGGLEKVAFRCRIDEALRVRAGIESSTEAVERLARWMAEQFETIREAALKTIRSERQLFTLVLDSGNPGPLGPA